MKARALIVLILCLGIYSCGAYSKNARVPGAPGTDAPFVEQEYRIRAGDKLAIKMFYYPDLNQDVTVRPDGKISLPLVHEVNALGLTPPELTELLRESYSKHLQQSEVVVIVHSFAGQRVYVAGEVQKPGVVEIVGPTTVLNAVASAGGFKDTARLKEIVVARRGPDMKPYLIALNIEQAMKGIDLNQDIAIQPYDMVLVPKSDIANVNVWVSQYIKGTIGSFSEGALYYNLTK